MENKITVEISSEAKYRIFEQIKFLYSDDKMDYIDVMDMSDEVVKNCLGEYPTQTYKRHYISFNLVMPVLFGDRAELVVFAIGKLMKYPDVVLHPQNRTDQEWIDCNIKLFLEFSVNDKLFKAINSSTIKKGPAHYETIYKINTHKLVHFTILNKDILWNLRWLKKYSKTL